MDGISPLDSTILVTARADSTTGEAQCTDFPREGCRNFSDAFIRHATQRIGDAAATSRGAAHSASLSDDPTTTSA